MNAFFKLYGWVGCILTMCMVSAANWPQFRGPKGSGVAAESENPPIEFSPTNNVAWKTPLPSGSSSPCIWKDKIFLTSFDGKVLETICLGSKDGKILWRKTAPTSEIERYFDPDGTPAASTPVTDGKCVYVYFGSCGLLAYDFNGKLKWSHPMSVAQTAGFGTGTSPVLWKDLLILNRDQSTNGHLLAFHKRNGKIAWDVSRPDYITSYGTPGVWEHGRQAEIVLPGFLRLKSYDAKTGKELWTMSGLPGAVCTSPVFGDGLLYLAAWSNGSSENPFPLYAQFAQHVDSNKDGTLDENELAKANMKGFLEFTDLNKDKKISEDEWGSIRSMAARGKNIMVAIQPGGRGDITSTHVLWQQTKGLPYVPSPLFYKGRIYLAKDGGLFSCFKAATGEPVYLQERLDAPGSYFSSPTAAHGRIYVCSAQGTVTVLEAEDQFKVLARNELKEKITASPAILDDTLYLRTANHLYAFRAQN